MNDLEFLDILNILSFIIGVLNYQENLTQGDKQDLMGEVDKTTQTILDEIHNHLNDQDIKIDKIMEILNEKNTEFSRPN